MEIHERIKLLREAKGLSQSDMATNLKIATQNYWKIEKGKTELTVSRLTQIADVLGVSVLELMTGEKQKVNDNHLEERLKLIERILKDKEELIGFKNRQLEAVENYFLKFFYNEIAKTVYNKGYSQKIFVDASTGARVKVSDKDYSENTLYLENIDFPEPIRVLHAEFYIIPTYKIEAINYYFLNEIFFTGKDYRLITVIMESGIIKDRELVIAYEKVKNIDSDSLKEDEEINDSLEVVKKNAKSFKP